MPPLTAKDRSDNGNPTELDAQPPHGDLPDRILGLLGPAPVSVDDIVRETAEPAGLVRGALLELELAGQIERQPGDFVVRLFDSAESHN